MMGVMNPLPTPAAAQCGPAIPADSGPAVWRGSHFDALSGHDLDAIYRARQLVFVLEQQCAYLDADGCDSASFHLTAWAAAATAAAPLVLAYARILPPGLKYAEPAIGRVLTRAEVRGTGLGRELVRRAVAQTQLAFPGHAIRISAQAHLRAFYAAAGFVSVGAPYLEDGIAHLEMLRDA